MTTDPAIAVRYSEAALPTRWGEFRVLVYKTNGEGDRREDEAVALTRGRLDADGGALVRVHSECLTGEALGSLRCDCRAQLDAALEQIAAEGGVLIYLRQEGRGIGLGNKIRAYALQDQGRDTVDANLALGFAADERNYPVAAAILRDLGISSIRLLTNNPDKVAHLAAAGIDVVQEAHWVETHAASHDYLDTKRNRLGHTSPDDVVAEPAKKANRR